MNAARREPGGVGDELEGNVIPDRTPSQKMTKTERDALARLVRLRAKQAKAEAVQREKVLLAEVEDLMAAEFEAREVLSAEAIKIMQEAVDRANAETRAHFQDLGIPKKFQPSATVGWNRRSSEFADQQRRAELRKVAQSRLTALTATAKVMIDAEALKAEEALIVGGLESGEAKAFLEAIPTAAQLMPSLTLDDLGVKHWQPPEGIAAALVTPSTTADRKRRQVLRAIEANPDGTLREIARAANVDHHTVAKYRAERGELPSESGEFPTNDEAES